MRPDIEQLLRVQHHDQKIRSLEKEKAGIPLEKEDIEERVTAARAEVEAAREEVQRAEVAVKRVELDVETRQDSIAKLKVQQFETKKNDEFRRMGEEIEHYGEEISGLEDRELELMEEAEELKKKLAQAEADLDKRESNAAEEKGDLDERLNQLEAEIVSEREGRASCAEGLDEALVYDYERLFQGKNGLAVVGLVDGVCQGCHMRVVKSTVVETKAEKAPARCENCGRILYWWTAE